MGLNIALWLAQVLVAILFAMSGIMKAFTPIAELMNSAPWVADVPLLLVRFIGVAELAGAVGVLVPALARILPSLTPLAAAALALVMALACGFHLTRGEPVGAAINVALALPALFVAWGRFRKAPIAPRRKA